MRRPSQVDGDDGVILSQDRTNGVISQLCGFGQWISPRLFGITDRVLGEAMNKEERRSGSCIAEMDVDILERHSLVFPIIKRGDFALDKA